MTEPLTKTRIVSTRRREGGDHTTMTAEPKMSEIMKEMSEVLLRRPSRVPSSEAAHVALFFANVAWNESVGLDHARDSYRSVWETIEAENPALWDEFKASDVNALIDGLIGYGGLAFEDDRPDTLAEALASLERGLAEYFEREGIELEE